MITLPDKRGPRGNYADAMIGDTFQGDVPFRIIAAKGKKLRVCYPANASFTRHPRLGLVTIKLLTDSPKHA